MIRDGDAQQQFCRAVGLEHKETPPLPPRRALRYSISTIRDWAIAGRLPTVLSFVCQNQIHV